MEKAYDNVKWDFVDYMFCEECVLATNRECGLRMHLFGAIFQFC